MRIPPLVWGMVGIAALVTLVIFLAGEFPGSLSDQDSQIGITYGGLLLAAMVGSAVLGRRFRNVPVFRYAAIWLAIGLAVFAGFSFRDEVSAVYNRLLGELLPHQARLENGSVVIRKSAGGHFITQAFINGTAVTFLIDTGASDVMISPRDARRLGFDPDAMDFTKIYRTANGNVYGAPLRLASISIGPLVIQDVRASVNSAEMKNSLLGMSFLERLSGYEVRGNSSFLKP